MLDLSESLRLSIQTLELCGCLSSFCVVEGLAAAALLTGLRARLEQPLRLLQRHDDRLQAAVTAGVAANHRVANAVMAAALQTDALAQRAQGSALAPGLERVCQQLSRIGSMVTEVRTALCEHEGRDGEAIAWRPVVEGVASRRGLGVDASQENLPARVLCALGEAGLTRILEELADNVPEGANGRIEARRYGALHVSLAVVDDGPGLSMSSASAREPFSTDRSSAVGVGLFVVDCLARAGGGHLEVRPGEQGGTVAAVHLLEEPFDG